MKFLKSCIDKKYKILIVLNVINLIKNHNFTQLLYFYVPRGT